MRRAWLLVLAAALGSAAAFLPRSRAAETPRPFTLDGVVRVQPGLGELAEREDCVLLVVARNDGGIPVAVRRIQGPRFPQSFVLTEEDLLFPGLKNEGPFRVAAALSLHGQAGLRKPGDLEGNYPFPTRPGEGPVPITIDRPVL